MALGKTSFSYKILFCVSNLCFHEDFRDFTNKKLFAILMPLLGRNTSGSRTCLPNLKILHFPGTTSRRIGKPLNMKNNSNWTQGYW